MSLRKTLLAVAMTAVAVTGRATQVNVNGIIFEDLSGGRAKVSGISDAISAHPVVPAVVTLANDECPVTMWVEYAFDAAHNNVSADKLVTLRSEDGEGSLYIWGRCISGWTALTSIELPIQLTQVDCDFITNCPALRSITLRSPQPVMFDSPYDTGSSNTLGSSPVLYVQPDLVEHYEQLRADDSAGKYARNFLRQVSEIRPIDNSGLSPGAHVIVGDMHLSLPDAVPGQRITIQAPEGQSILGVKMDGQTAAVDNDSRAQFTLPDFDHHMVMAVDLSSSSQSGIADATVPVDGPIRILDGAIQIAGYDGSEVIVLDLAGRVIRRTHRHTIPLPQGHYILLYQSRAHKILINR